MTTKVLLAIGHPAIHEEIKKFQNITVCAIVEQRGQLLSAVNQLKPDIVMVSEFLQPRTLDLSDLAVQIREISPSTRVVYIAGMLDANNSVHKQLVQKLAAAKIYDIHMINHISTKILEEYIFSPASIQQLDGWIEIEKPRSSLLQTSTLTPQKTLSENIPDASTEPVLKTEKPLVEPSFSASKSESSTDSSAGVFNKSASSFIPTEEMRTLAEDVVKEIEKNNQQGEYFLPKLFVVSSIKPGCGKTFVSSNLATAIAEYGIVGPEGRKPRVALIEGDLQTLSIGTVLAIKEDGFNLKTAIEKIDSIIDARTGMLKPGIEPYQIDEVDRFIKKCFKEYNLVKNLYALVGSQFRPDELGLVTGYHYTYLIETIHSMFDVVIVDTNSSLNHITTYPLLMLANQVYYVLNLDFNNIRNNVLYKNKLVSLGIGNKIKYILNEDISQNKDNKEKLRFGPDELIQNGFELCGSIPAIDKAVFLNRLHAGIPIALDKEKITLKARLEIERIAQDIWPMDNIVLLESEHRKHEATQLRTGKTTKSPSKGFSFFKH